MERVLERRNMQTFPPVLERGNRVWTNQGYQDHGPLEGPKVDIAPRQGGTIAAVEQPYYTMDRQLYTVRWDDGQISKHYGNELFCIGRFQNREKYEEAITPRGPVELTVGPNGGFRKVRLELDYDGQVQTTEIRDRKLWQECLEPLIKKSGIEISTTQLKRGE
jgi:hypothetical protein